MITRLHLAAADVEPPLLWRLLDALAARGADEFTLDVMALADVPAERADAFEDALEPWVRPPAIRPILDAAAAAPFPGRVRLWALGARTLPLLRRFLPHGTLRLDAQAPAEDGWFENLTVYRDGELVFAAVTGEGVAVLQLRPGEREELEALGIALRA